MAKIQDRQIQNKQDNSGIIILAVLAAVLAFIALISVFYSVAIYSGLTGKATASGAANLTIAVETAINISNATIAWGEGRIGADYNYFALNTSAGTVSGGNWTAVKTGFLVENIGNVNVSIKLKSSAGNASIFLGNSSSAVFYQWNISNYEAGACGSGGFTKDVFSNVNTSNSGGANFDTIVCNQMAFTNTKDVIEIDFSVAAGDDIETGVKRDTITITATAS